MTTQAAGKTLLLLYNLILKANIELGVTDKVGASLKDAIDNAKAGESVCYIGPTPSALLTF